MFAGGGIYLTLGTTRNVPLRLEFLRPKALLITYVFWGFFAVLLASSRVAVSQRVGLQRNTLPIFQSLWVQQLLCKVP